MNVGVGRDMCKKPWVQHPKVRSIFSFSPRKQARNIWGPYPSAPVRGALPPYRALLPWCRGVRLGTWPFSFGWVSEVFFSQIGRDMVFFGSFCPSPNWKRNEFVIRNMDIPSSPSKSKTSKNSYGLRRRADGIPVSEIHDPRWQLCSPGTWSWMEEWIESVGKRSCKRTVQGHEGVWTCKTTSCLNRSFEHVTVFPGTRHLGDDRSQRRFCTARGPEKAHPLTKQIEKEQLWKWHRCVFWMVLDGFGWFLVWFDGFCSCLELLLFHKRPGSSRHRPKLPGDTWWTPKWRCHPARWRRGSTWRSPWCLGRDMGQVEKHQV